MGRAECDAELIDLVQISVRITSSSASWRGWCGSVSPSDRWAWPSRPSGSTTRFSMRAAWLLVPSYGWQGPDRGAEPARAVEAGEAEGDGGVETNALAGSVLARSRTMGVQVLYCPRLSLVTCSGAVDDPSGHASPTIVRVRPRRRRPAPNSPRMTETGMWITREWHYES
jgi:hypothetical protein